jgi:homoaconitase/3-isopropylmalate dehydratase large subunit
VYVDLRLTHEVTSPQAFTLLRDRKVARGVRMLVVPGSQQVKRADAAGKPGDGGSCGGHRMRHRSTRIDGLNRTGH